MSVEICWLSGVVLAVLAHGLRSALGHWGHPATISLAFWSLLFLCAGILGFGSSASGAMVLVSGVLSFAAAALAPLFYSPVSRHTSPSTALRDRDVPACDLATRLVVPMALLSVLGALAVVGLLAPRGLGAGTLADAQQVRAVAIAYARLRYQTDTPGPTLARYLSLAHFTGALLAGLALACPQRRTWLPRALLFVPVLESVVYASLLTARAELLYSLIYLASGYLAGCAWYGRPPQLPVRLRQPVLLLLLGALLPLWFAGIRLLRGGVALDAPRVWQDSLRPTEVAIAGSVEAFSAWLPDRDLDPPTLGKITFVGVLRPLGLATRSGGVYTSFVTVRGDARTNVFTAFRGLIQDFGIPGALAASASWGFLVGLAYVHVRAGRSRWIPVLCLGYFSIGWSHVVSPFTYALIVAAPLLQHSCFLVLRLAGPARTRDAGDPTRQERDFFRRDRNQFQRAKQPRG